MSEGTEATETVATETTTTEAVTPAPAQEPDWKADARKWEARAKENKTAADELAALKASQMTEAEKSAARLAELESTVKGYQAKEQASEWAKEITQGSSVPPEVLRGSTREELEAHFASLSSLITNAPVQRGPIIPSEGSGSDAPAGQSQITESVLATMTPAEINVARKAGRLNQLLGIN